MPFGRSRASANIFVLVFIRRPSLGGWLYDVETRNTHALQRRNTLQTMVIAAREGQAAAARHMGQEAAPSLRITAALCVCAWGQNCGLTSRQPLENNHLVQTTVYGAPI